LSRCEIQSDCRLGWSCDLTASLCRPNPIPTDRLPSLQQSERHSTVCSHDYSATEEALSTVFSLPFTLRNDTESFLLIPWVGRGGIVPKRLHSSAGSLELETDYRHHNMHYLEGRYDDFKWPSSLGFEIAQDWPILFPFAKEYAALVQPGESYRLDVETDRAPPCLTIVEASGGLRLHLNLHILDSRLNLETISENPNIIEVLDTLRQIFAKADIAVETVQFEAAGSDALERFPYLRTQTEIQLVTALSRRDNEVWNPQMTVEVFLVEDIVLSKARFVGFSGSVPGVPGLQGQPGNGVVLSLVDLGESNLALGYALAHEIGHFLGLRHTTEFTTSSWNEIDALWHRSGNQDPIPDTPTCSALSQLRTRCPDAVNLMFPVGAIQPPNSVREEILSPEQRWVLQRNPALQ
jgi:hypothetical protein